MRISDRGRITIPKALRDWFGMNRNVEVEIIAPREGLLIRKQAAAIHPVERVYAILDSPGGTDDYVADVRGK